jgi:hypothetical protein
LCYETFFGGQRKIFVLGDGQDILQLGDGHYLKF